MDGFANIPALLSGAPVVFDIIGGGLTTLLVLSLHRNQPRPVQPDNPHLMYWDALTSGADYLGMAAYTTFYLLYWFDYSPRRLLTYLFSIPQHGAQWTVYVTLAAWIAVTWLGIWNIRRAWGQPMPPRRFLDLGWKMFGLALMLAVWWFHFFFPTSNRASLLNQAALSFNFLWAAVVTGTITSHTTALIIAFGRNRPPPTLGPRPVPHPTNL